MLCIAPLHGRLVSDQVSIKIKSGHILLYRIRDQSISVSLITERLSLGVEGLGGGGGLWRWGKFNDYDYRFIATKTQLEGHGEKNREGRKEGSSKNNLVIKTGGD